MNKTRKEDEKCLIYRPQIETPFSFTEKIYPSVILFND